MNSAWDVRIGRFFCWLFGHHWYYQRVALSEAAGELPARVCTRCEPFRRIERLYGTVWVLEP